MSEMSCQIRNHGNSEDQSLKRAKLQAGLSLRAHELEFFLCMNMNSAEATGFHIKPNKTPGGLTFAFQKNLICAFNTEVPWLPSEEAHQRATVRLKKKKTSFISLQDVFLCVMSVLGSHYASLWLFSSVAQQQYLNQVAAKQTPATPPTRLAVQRLFLVQFWRLLLNKTTILSMVGATTLDPMVQVRRVKARQVNGEVVNRISIF